MLKIVNAAQTLGRLRPFYPGINLGCLRNLVCDEFIKKSHIIGIFNSKIARPKKGTVICVGMKNNITLRIEVLEEVTEIIDWQDSFRCSALGRVRVTVI